MHCPNCGAALVFSPFCEVAECVHCGSSHSLRLADVGEDRIVWGEDPTGSKCPRCRLDLVHAMLDGCPAEACRECRGVMLTHTVFGSIVRHRRAEYHGADYTPQPLDLDDLSPPVHCPRCQRMMEVHPYYGPGNQIIDSCVRCGLVWIDSGELTAIERAPGLR